MKCPEKISRSITFFFVLLTFIVNSYAHAQELYENTLIKAKKLELINAHFQYEGFDSPPVVELLEQFDRSVVDEVLDYIEYNQRFRSFDKVAMLKILFEACHYQIFSSDLYFPILEDFYYFDKLAVQAMHYLHPLCEQHRLKYKNRGTPLNEEFYFEYWVATGVLRLRECQLLKVMPKLSKFAVYKALTSLNEFNAMADSFRQFGDELENLLTACRVKGFDDQKTTLSELIDVMKAMVPYTQEQRIAMDF